MEKHICDSSIMDRTKAWPPECDHSMALAADRMKAMRERRRARGLRELRLVVPDARSKQVRRRVAKQVATLDREHELDAMRWIEAVSEFDTR